MAMRPRLLHYSAQPFAGPVKTRAGELSIDSKPRGLWVSVEGRDDWPTWCRGEEFELADLRCVSEIVLHRNAKLIRLTTAVDIDAFHAAYSATLYPDRPNVCIGMAIDWPRVAARYDGIIIAPYQWGRRLDHATRWYYGWDCASGCIWRARAVADVRPLGDTPAEAS